MVLDGRMTESLTKWSVSQIWKLTTSAVQAWRFLVMPTVLHCLSFLQWQYDFGTTSTLLFLLSGVWFQMQGQWIMVGIRVSTSTWDLDFFFWGGGGGGNFIDQTSLVQKIGCCFFRFDCYCMSRCIGVWFYDLSILMISNGMRRWKQKTCNKTWISMFQ